VTCQVDSAVVFHLMTSRQTDTDTQLTALTTSFPGQPS